MNPNQNPIVIFRADAGSTQGFGHLMRCINLGQHLKKRGVHVFFFCQPLPKFISCRLISLEIPFYILPACSLTQLDNWQLDFENFRSVIDALRIKASWLIIDHYLIDYRWQFRFKKYYPESRILVIDDLADRVYVCDALIDPGLNSSPRRYRTKVPLECQQFHGTDYVFLGDAFCNYKPEHPINNFEQKTLHMFMGSQDLNQLTIKYCGLILKNFKDIKLQVVVGPNFQNLKELNNLTMAFETLLDIELGPSDLCNSLLKCNLAFGAPGSTTWERAFFGIPSAYVSIHHNQENILTALADDDFCSYFGNAYTLSEEQFLNCFSRFLYDSEYLKKLSAHSLLSVDGLGVQRGGDIICAKI